MLRLRLAAPLFALIAACSASLDIEDGADDSAFAGDGKFEGQTLSAAEVDGVLAVVNELDKARLDDEVGLSSRVASNISKHRAAADKKLGTADDDLFDTLKELDDVPYVGKTVIKALLEYARDNGYIRGQEDLGPCASTMPGRTPGGQPTTLCKTLYPEAPFVRPPPDSAGVYYVGIVSMGSGRVLAYDRKGNDYTLLDSHGQEIDLDEHRIAGLDEPNNMQAVFKVTGKKGTFHDSTFGDVPSIQVTKLEPAIYLPGKVLDDHFLGAWEGDVSQHIPGGTRFDPQHTTRVRFLFTMSQSNDRFMNSIAPGAEGQKLLGVIDNFDAGAKDSTGHCLPAITTLGDKNPFYGATSPAIDMYRHPNMHGIHDQVIVFTYPEGFVGSVNGMDGMNPWSPSALIQVEANDRFDEIDGIRGHGTPNGHIISHLRKVSDRATTSPCR